jgi:hypothetical protein
MAIESEAARVTVSSFARCIRVRGHPSVRNLLAAVVFVLQAPRDQL